MCFLAACLRLLISHCTSAERCKGCSLQLGFNDASLGSSVSALLLSAVGEGRLRDISCCRAAILRHLDQASTHDGNASSRGCLGAERRSLHLCDVTPDYEA
jgi:hypothetical protein